MITARNRKQRRLNIDGEDIFIIIVILAGISLLSLVVIDVWHGLRDKHIAIDNIPVTIEEFKAHYQAMYNLTPIAHACPDERWPRCNVSFYEPDGDVVVYSAYCDVDSCSSELP